ncbi:MAG: hypothetical protein F6K00_33855 [Leptolyngbya sp. SIOISBB]|nr:hypothetical protein [Leptolyngbya sp. SIOISBB]
MSFHQRDRLYQALTELGLVEPCHPVFALNLLQSLSSECIALWTRPAFIAVAHAISQYWLASREDA